MALKWFQSDQRPVITRIMLSGPSKEGGPTSDALMPNIPRASCGEIEMIMDQIEAFAAGEPVKFNLNILQLTACPLFQFNVLLADASIPRGRVSTYGQISASLGITNGARAVGTALATNPFPLVIPCHRAVRSDGSLGGFQGGLPMKKKLLEMEGIQFDFRNRVVNPDFYGW